MMRWLTNSSVAAGRVGQLCDRKLTAVASGIAGRSWEGGGATRHSSRNMGRSREALRSAGGEVLSRSSGRRQDCSVLRAPFDFVQEYLAL